MGGGGDGCWGVVDEGAWGGGMGVWTKGGTVPVLLVPYNLLLGGHLIMEHVHCATTFMNSYFIKNQQWVSRKYFTASQHQMVLYYCPIIPSGQHSTIWPSGGLLDSQS